MSIETKQDPTITRVTFRPSKDVVQLLEKVKVGDRTDFINDQLVSNKRVESALRAARLKIAELERQISSKNICQKCTNQGCFVGVVLGITDGKVKTQRITTYCTCTVGLHLMQTNIVRQQKLLDEGVTPKEVLAAVL